VDLSPGYREIAPPEALRGVVACLWVRVLDVAREVRVVPDGCTDLVWRRGQGVLVAGPDTGAKVDRFRAGDLLIGVRFTPGAAGGVLGLPLDELRDLRVDALEVDRAFFLDPDLAPAEVLRKLMSGCVVRPGVDPLVAAAVRRLGREQLNAIAKDLYVSERQLLRRFRVAVGYGPATLRRVLRFQRFVEAVDAGRTELASLALDAGYADQAHLTRETRRLAGLSPLAFVRNRGGDL
jgi:AraC-like DNA-binding protein